MKIGHLLSLSLSPPLPLSYRNSCNYDEQGEKRELAENRSEQNETRKENRNDVAKCPYLAFAYEMRVWPFWF